MAKLASLLAGSFQITILAFAPGPKRYTEQCFIAGQRAHVHHGRFQQFVADPAWLVREMRRGRPAAVLVIGPAFLVGALLQQLQTFRSTTKILLYLPIEGRAIGAALTDHLARVDHCILYTEAARRDIEALCHDRLKKDDAFRAPSFSVVGHGVDISAFAPFPSIERTARRRAARQQLFPERADLWDAFIVLNANRPYRRKRLDLTIRGFASFARLRSDSRLVLHVGARSVLQDTELRREIALCGMNAQIVLSPTACNGAPLSVPGLNDLYNACDIGLTTAMGEGWGLSTFEHAATGAPQIVPDHTSFRENWTDAAIILPCADREIIFYESAEMFSTTPEAVAEAIALLYGDASLRESLGRAAYARVTQTRYSWETVGSRFTSLILERIDHAALSTAH
jgi:glycosyltransferase involved in cell wall biosynthesis